MVEKTETDSKEELAELDQQDVNNPEDGNEDEESQEEMDSDDSESEDEEDSDKEDSGADGEYEIVLDGEEGLSEKESKTQKYHNRMNERKAEANKAKEGEAEANAKLDAKDRELALYKQLVDKQAGQGVEQGPPNPEDAQRYPEGAYDPAYIKDINAFHANQAAVQANQRILEARAEDEKRRQIETKKGEVEKYYESHYERATSLDKKLKNKDYDAMEKVAVEILGETKTDFIVETFDNSELIFYKFGKDPAKAKYFSGLLDSSPGRALKEMGVFESKIKKVKRKINKTPDPEKRTPGGYIKSKKGERGPPGAKYK